VARGSIQTPRTLAPLRFYRDLGLTEFYRRPVDPACSKAERGSGWRRLKRNFRRGSRLPSTASTNFAQEESAIPRARASPHRQTASAVAPKPSCCNVAIAEDLGDCKRCQLHKAAIPSSSARRRQRAADVCGRRAVQTKTNRGSLVGRAVNCSTTYLGHGPRARADLHLQRGQVPPARHRTPEPDEANTALRFSPPDRRGSAAVLGLWARRLRPICSASASLWLGCAGVHAFRGSSLIVTIIRPTCFAIPAEKGSVADLQIAMKELG